MGGRPKVSVTLTDDQLVELYFNKQPLHLLCEQHDVEEYAINEAWTKLKTEGKIKQSRRRVIRADHLYNYPALSDTDGRPHVGTEDKLLMRLYEVHSHPRYDIARSGVVMG
jgi:hypothetical protein